jgi:tetrahydromethanopterin S-methyltransferase subunit G
MSRKRKLPTSNGMEESEIRQRLDALEKKIDAVYVSAEKTRKYFLTVIIVSLVAFVLPLIGLLFAIPSFLSTYGEIGGLLQ